MIRKFIANISTETLLRIAMIPTATIVHLLWALFIGPGGGILLCIQVPLLTIQITALILWIRRNRIGKGQS